MTNMQSTRIISILFFSLHVLIGCNGIDNKISSSTAFSFSNIKFEGLYTNQDNEGISLNILSIKKNRYYFQIDNKLKSSKGYNYFEGVFEVLDSGITINLFCDQLVKIEFTLNSDKSINIKFPNSNVNSEWQIITGLYKKSPISSQILSFQKTKILKWDEVISIKDTNIKIYNFPDTSSFMQQVLIRKGDTFRIYQTLFDTDKIESFFYLKSFQKKELGGWIDRSDYANNLMQKFACEEYDDGRIEKDNRQEKHYIMYDKNGKIIKEEHY